MHDKFARCFLSCKNIFGYNKYIKFALGFHLLNTDLQEKDLRDFMNEHAATNRIC